jgi:hypothetical protein
MAVCQVCQSIDIRDLLESFHGSEAFDGVVTYSSPLDYLGVTENYQPHHSNFAALRDAAKAGCGFCGMVVAHHHKPSRWQHDEDDCECNRFLGPVRLAVFQDDSDHYAALHIIIMSEEKEPMPAWVITKLEICVAKGERVLSLFPPSVLSSH